MCFLKGILPPKLVSLSIGLVCNLATPALHQLIYVHFLDFSPEMYMIFYVKLMGICN
jgi:hypothetical protein